MTRADRSRNRCQPAVHSADEYGRPASPVKAGLRPPPSAANGLDRACCPALVGHQAFDGGIRLMQGPHHTSTLTEAAYGRNI